MAGVASLFLIADLLSPGPLAKPHENLEGLKNCVKCHEAGQQVSDQKCLDCHKELKAQLAKGAGFHGHIPKPQLACNSCHHEHQGKDFALIEWEPRKFDHARTGFALKGKHAALDCAKCHVTKSFIGLSTACIACHKDEHRGQEGNDCAKCHDERAWKPAPGFVHAKTDFALKGAHQRVECIKCHAHEAGEAQRFHPVAHARCTDCHKDPHDGKLGVDCQRCHVEDSWTAVKSAGGERAFHEKTRYPLRGLHVSVACKECHGPWPGRKAVFKNMKFDACLDCHKDPHGGQLSPPACERCHDVNGFKPVRFETAQHEKTKYPLLGAHLAVGCAQCHPATKARGFFFHPESARCENCHQDPHKAQFKKACATCHEVASFRKVNVDHGKFPLTLGHAKAACGSCHFADASGVVRYLPLASTCASCHPDVHAGQFGDCARCHTTESFTKTLFVHAPPFTNYVLAGKHRDVACAKCHAPSPAGVKYRGTPKDCEGCHADFHKGAFAGFTP